MNVTFLAALFAPNYPLAPHTLTAAAVPTVCWDPRIHSAVATLKVCLLFD